jgi:hypothetical protein
VRLPNAASSPNTTRARRSLLRFSLQLIGIYDPIHIARPASTINLEQQGADTSSGSGSLPGSSQASRSPSHGSTSWIGNLALGMSLNLTSIFNNQLVPDT